MVNSVASGKTTKRVVRNVVFLLTLGFAALAFVATPLTAFAACPNETPAAGVPQAAVVPQAAGVVTQAARRTINRQKVNQNQAVLMGKNQKCQPGKRVRAKINGQGQTLNALCINQNKVVVTVNRRLIQLSIRQ